MDVFQVVKALRIQKPGSVLTVVSNLCKMGVKENIIAAPAMTKFGWYCFAQSVPIFRQCQHVLSNWR